jgi:hypothetical protein
MAIFLHRITATTPAPDPTPLDEPGSHTRPLTNVVYIEGLESKIMNAVIHGDLDAVRQCVEAGCDPNFAEGWPLHSATEAGRLDILAYLLPLTDVEATGHKALYHASRVGESPGAVELLATRADAATLRSAHDLAQSCRNASCADVLLRSLATLEAQEIESAAQPAQARAATPPRI